MRRIIPPIDPGDQGADVANLQDGLIALLRRGLIQVEPERRDELVHGVTEDQQGQAYRDATKDSVARFQEQRQLRAHGRVDEETAAALNEALREIGAFQDEPEHEQPRIEGHAFFENGSPAANITLRVYRRGYGGEDARLAETTVERENKGAYRLGYENRDGRPMSLEIRAVDLEGKEFSLTTTNPVSPGVEVINLIVPVRRVQKPEAEFTRLSRDLTAQLGDLRELAKAQEEGERQDITLLRQATGWDARFVALAATAFRLSETTGFAPVVLYACFRTGLPTEVESLARVESETVAQALLRAREAGIVAIEDEEIRAARAAFEEFALKARREARAPGALASSFELLARSGANEVARLTEDESKIFERLLLTHMEEPKALWKKAGESGISAEKLDALRLQGRLGYLTFNNAALVESLLQDLGDSDDPANLVEAGFFREDRWRSRLDALAGDGDEALNALIPPVYEGESAKARRDAYSADLARKVRLSFPTRVVARMLETDALTFRTGHDTLKTPVGTFLRNAEPLGFQLGKLPVNAFLREHSATVFAGIVDEDRAKATEGIKTLQRLYQITPTDGALKVMLEQGFTSAADVMEHSPEAFVERFGGLFASPAEAELVYRKAQQVSATAHAVVMSAKLIESEVSVEAISAPAGAKESAKKELSKHFPTLEGLFGSQDFCECEHCRSVLSPAAYLVDLLQFIDHKPAVWDSFLHNWRFTHAGTPYPFRDATEWNAFLAQWQTEHPGEPDPKTEITPFQVLMKRRPDLAHVELSCENTNTALPYIDLANQTLEHFVVHGGKLFAAGYDEVDAVLQNQLAAAAAYNLNGATTPELVAEPQHLLPGAYDELAGAKYPVTLPFDLWLETVRSFLGHAETPLWQILEIFRPTDTLFPPETPPKSYARADIFAEYLGLSPAERALFTSPDPLSTWFELYGYDSEAEALCEVTRYLPPNFATCSHLNAAGEPAHSKPGLPHAKTLARRLDVTYRELAEIVQCGFVNPSLGETALIWKLRIGVSEVARYFRERARPEYVPEKDSFEQRLLAFDNQFKLPAGSTLAELEAIGSSEAFAGTLILRDREPTGKCSFEQTWLEFTGGNLAGPLVFLRIALFVRLWKKLGWTIEETSRALELFFPAKSLPSAGDPGFGAAFAGAWQTALLYLAHFAALAGRLPLGRNVRIKLLTFWSEIATRGKNPLYAQLFLASRALKNDAAFDEPLGRYLTAPRLLQDHLLAVQGALGISVAEADAILARSGNTVATAPLTLPIVSRLFRYSLLAKGLRMPVPTLLTLEELWGQDPFKPLAPGPVNDLSDDSPFAKTLRFVEIAEAARASGFSVEDLDYLLRHRFADNSRYGAKPEGTLALMKTLAEGVRAIRREHAVPPDGQALGEDVMRQKLNLVLPNDVTERFMGMMNGSAEFVGTRGGVLSPLKAEEFVGEPAIVELPYDQTRQKQTLTVRLFHPDRKELEVRHPSSVFSELMKDAEKSAREFFENHLKKQTVRLEGEAGFLEESDFAKLFSLLEALERISPGDDPQQVEENNIEITKNNQVEVQNRYRLAAQRFFPYLQESLIRRLIVQTLSGVTSAEPTLIESLITDERLLAIDSVPLLAVFAAAGELAANVDVFDAGNPGFAGYLEVPVAGAYRFYIELETAGAEAELRFDHLRDPVFLKGTAIAPGTILGTQPDEYLELKPGTLYRFSLNLANLGGGKARALVQGESLSKGALSRLGLYSQTVVDRVARAERLLMKSLQFIQGLTLSELELRHIFGTHAANFAGRLDQLCAVDAGDPPDVVNERFSRFLNLAAYASLRRESAGEPESLIAIFENATRFHAGAPDIDKAKSAHFEPFARLVNQKPEAVLAIAEHFKLIKAATVEAGGVRIEAPALATLDGCRRIFDAVQIVGRLGIPVEAVVRATGIVVGGTKPEDRFAIARDLVNAVKARHTDEEAWRRLAQALFDPLRQRRRDALVAWITFREGFSSKEELFDRLYVDAGMEPVVQTSPIRLATASVQFFIRDVLLNRVPEVHPSAIDSKWWETLQNYPILAGAKSLFIHPENVLDEAFRDNKTAPFRQCESDLLGGPITAEAVEAACFKLLQGYQKIEHLQIVAMCRQESPLAAAANVLHVIGRTGSNPHEYFYRRYANNNMWTPWEPVDAPLEGDHVLAVIWRDRLHLFWLKFLDKAKAPENSKPPEGSNAAKQTVANLRLSELRQGLANLGPTLKEISVELNWSEFLGGEWTTPESSGFAEPVKVLVTDRFEPRTVGMHASKVFEGGEERALKIHLHFDKVVQYEHPWLQIHLEPIGNLLAGGVTIQKPSGHLMGVGLNKLTGADPDDGLKLVTAHEAFQIVSRHDPPRPVTGDAPPAQPFSVGQVEATRLVGSGSLNVTFVEKIKSVTGKSDQAIPQTRAILQRKTGRFYLLTCADATQLASMENGALLSPFFYQDDQCTFFVEPALTETPVQSWEWYGVAPPAGTVNPKKFDFLETVPLSPKSPIIEPPVPVEIDPRARFRPQINPDWLADPGTVLRFDGRIVDQEGAHDYAVLPPAGAMADFQASIAVNAGSELAPGVLVVASERSSANPARVTRGGAGLNVVGSGGLNATLLENITWRDTAWSTGFVDGSTEGQHQ